MVFGPFFIIALFSVTDIELLVFSDHLTSRAMSFGLRSLSTAIDPPCSPVLPVCYAS